MAGPIEKIRLVTTDFAAIDSLEAAQARIRELEEIVAHQEKRRLALRRFEKSVETMQLGVTVTDLNGKIVYVNPADAEMHGYPVDELIGKDVGLFSDARKREPLRPEDLDEIRSWRRQGVNVRKDGTGFPVQLMSDVVRDSDGIPVGVVTTCEDITERIRTEAALRDSEQRYALAAEGASVGLWDWDIGSGNVFYSRRWKQLLGYEAEEIEPGVSEWMSRIHPEDRERVDAEVQAAIQSNRSLDHFESEHRLLHKEGSYRWFLCRGVVVTDDDGITTRLVGSQSDITERKRVQQQLLEDAFHDGLTGLPNRTLFETMVERCLGRERRSADYKFAVLIVDLDRFKVVNDSLGHTMGDKLLVAVGRRLKPCLRPADTLARFGGDQFGILLEDTSGLSDPSRVARRILEQLSGEFTVDGRVVYLSASIGIAASGTGYDNPFDLVRDADTAMHRSKINGTGRFEVFDSEMREQVVSRLKLETELRNVVEHGELRTYYQPVVTLRGEKLVGFEALLRWEHPDRGLLVPCDFIGVAEETNLIIPMGWWILSDACHQLKSWHENLGNTAALGVSVNLSGKQLVQADAFERVQRVLDDTRLVKGSLQLEMTETVMMEAGARSTELCNRLKELSVRLHMDDFGTGYSSLSYLHSFPLDILKIDRSFVARMTEQDKFSEIVRTIVNMAHNLGLKVVAEGVESAEQANLLASFGCDFAQGFHYSRPVDARGAEALIESLGVWSG